jgi:nucleoside-diphosphate-sugar epimerase
METSQQDENMTENDSKIIITGAAGLVGQNLVHELSSRGYANLTAIDKNEHNLSFIKQLHPNVKTVAFDLAKNGAWEELFEGAETLFLLQAQITGLKWEEFEENTLHSTQNVIAAAQKYYTPFTFFVSSFVLKSLKSDNYSRSKTQQEKMVIESNIPCCVLRPTLMFGWFDPKHLGWLSRFMKKVPVFPIPGSGEFIRQPLYVRDFCRALIWCAENKPEGKTFELAGAENITYIEIIKTIKIIMNCKTLILKIPIPIFRMLLKIYSVFSKHPPFVSDQLESLTAGDFFTGDSFKDNFNFEPTPFKNAMEETLTTEPYCSIVLERTVSK